MIQLPSGRIVKEVKNDEDIETYLDILRRSHQMLVGPDNPYDEYSKVELKLIKKNLRELTRTQ